MFYPVEFIHRLPPATHIQLELSLVADETTIRLKVIKPLRMHTAFYSMGDVIEITPQEAFVLRNRYSKHFEVVL